MPRKKESFFLFFEAQDVVVGSNYKVQKLAAPVAAAMVGNQLEHAAINEFYFLEIIFIETN